MNVLIITIDTLRYDYISYANNYKNSLTPNIDEFSKEGLIYHHVFSSGTSTPFAFPGILSSIYSSQTKTPGIFNSYLTFSEYLRNKGYFTIGFNGGNIYVSNIYGYDRGMDYLEKHYVLNTKFKKNSFLRNLVKRSLKFLGLKEFIIKMLETKNTFKKVLWNNPLIYRAQDQITDFVKILKENRKRKFFAFINFMEVHGPYLGLWETNFKERIFMEKLLRKKMYSNDEKMCDYLKFFYTRGIKMVDQQISILLNFLDTEGILDNTIVILTSDHGEEFLEHGNYDHLPKPYDELIRVPFIVFMKNKRFSKEEKYAESTRLISLVDIAPTISMFLFGEKPKEFVGKNSFLGGKEIRHYIFSEGFRNLNNIRHDATKKGVHNWCIRTKNLKYMELDRKKYLFDLLNDPNEQKPKLINKKEELKPEIKELLTKHSKELLHFKLKNHRI